MWSSLSGSAGSSWPVLEVPRTLVWSTSRSGENGLVPSWLLPFISRKVVCPCLYTVTCDMWAYALCRFTTVAEVLYGVREQLQKMQDQNNKYNTANASSLTATIDEIERFILSLITKLLTKWDMASRLCVIFSKNTLIWAKCWHAPLCSCFSVLWWLRNNPSCKIYIIDL